MLFSSKANKILSDLKFSDFLTSEEPLSDDIAGDDDDASVAEDENITLRLRHRGKIHKYSVKDVSIIIMAVMYQAITHYNTHTQECTTHMYS